MYNDFENCATLFCLIFLYEHVILCPDSLCFECFGFIFPPPLGFAVHFFHKSELSNPKDDPSLQYQSRTPPHLLAARKASLIFSPF